MTNETIYAATFYVYAYIRKHDSITAKAGKGRTHTDETKQKMRDAYASRKKS